VNPPLTETPMHPSRATLRTPSPLHREMRVYQLNRANDREQFSGSTSGTLEKAVPKHPRALTF